MKTMQMIWPVGVVGLKSPYLVLQHTYTHTHTHAHTHTHTQHVYTGDVKDVNIVYTGDAKDVVIVVWQGQGRARRARRSRGKTRREHRGAAGAGPGAKSVVQQGQGRARGHRHDAGESGRHGETALGGTGARAQVFTVWRGHARGACNRAVTLWWRRLLWQSTSTAGTSGAAPRRTSWRRRPCLRPAPSPRRAARRCTSTPRTSARSANGQVAVSAQGRTWPVHRVGYGQHTSSTQPAHGQRGISTRRQPAVSAWSDRRRDGQHAASRRSDVVSTCLLDDARPRHDPAHGPKHEVRGVVEPQRHGAPRDGVGAVEEDGERHLLDVPDVHEHRRPQVLVPSSNSVSKRSAHHQQAVSKRSARTLMESRNRRHTVGTSVGAHRHASLRAAVQFIKGHMAASSSVFDPPRMRSMGRRWRSQWNRNPTNHPRRFKCTTRPVRTRG